jgi:hypothetical protein
MYKLASSPDPVCARKVRTSKTATVNVSGTLATGTIADRTSLCVLLRFQDLKTLFCNIADLVDTGFDLPLTPAPDTLFQQEKIDKGTVKTRTLRLYMGELYQMDSASADVAQCRRLYASPAIESLPVALLEPVAADSQCLDL